MGIDTALALDNLDDEFVCAICTDILENPVEISRCEHNFCDSCIRKWIQDKSECPIDRDPAVEAGLGRPRRFFRNKLAEVRLRCPFSGTEITHEAFERHTMNCRENPDAWRECNFCHAKHMINEEVTHQQSCLPFLRDKIDKRESEVKQLKRKYEEEIRLVKRPRTSRYILTWNAKFPTPQYHQTTCNEFYSTWNRRVGNLVDGAVKRNPRFKLDRGDMSVGLRLKRVVDERRISIQFHLTTGNKGRVKFNWSLSSEGRILWQQERTEQLEVQEAYVNTGWTGGHINEDLPSNLPSDVLVIVEVIEWEPNTE